MLNKDVTAANMVTQFEPLCFWEYSAVQNHIFLPGFVRWVHKNLLKLYAISNLSAGPYAPDLTHYRFILEVKLLISVQRYDVLNVSAISPEFPLLRSGVPFSSAGIKRNEKKLINSHDELGV